MTTYIAAYDTENKRCLDALPRIVEVHEQYEMPATFFICARLLEERKRRNLMLLRDHPLFEIACHTYSHMPVVDTPRYGKKGDPAQYPMELVESKRMLEEAFGCSIIGFRPPVSSPTGLSGAAEVLGILQDAGYRYASSVAWGPDFSLPAPLTKPFTYKKQGFPAMWEFPACGWHENLLKGNNKIGPVLLVLFPTPMPEAIPPNYISSPEEEFRYNNKPFIDKALSDGMPLVTLIWHPWSLHAFDPDMKMQEITFAYVRERRLATKTFAAYLEEMPRAGGFMSRF